MKSSARFTSNRRNFLLKNEQFIDLVGNHMAQDIEVIIKTGGRTPVKSGDMKANVRAHKESRGKYRVNSYKEYSAAQEIGSRQGHPFRHYTTPGTGRGWFKQAVEQVTRRANAYVDEVARSLRI